jgi:aspartyl-tRNA(Asn)/glutamyl-tRNA(Gln) amidotransferase subunit A
MADIDRISDRTCAGIALAYRSGETDPVAVTECLLDRIEKAKADNVFITVTAERALAEAKASAARYRADAPLSALDGVPIAWKDLVDVAGAPTTVGSKYLSKGPIKSTDQICVANAAAAGMVTMGKLNQSELAYTALGLNPHFGTPRNPRGRDTLYAPGGSSSGSGAAVAARLVPCALGTDTGGSVRIPSAFNGVVGYKTSHGRVDSTGMVPLARSYDTIGPLARSVEDCILVERAFRGAVGAEIRRAPLHGITIVAPTNAVTVDAEKAVVENFERTLEVLAKRGALIRRERVDLLDELVEVTARRGSLASAEAYHEHFDLIESAHVAALDRQVVHRIMQGKAMSANDVIAIQRMRQRRIPELSKLLDSAFLVQPTCPTTAPEVAPLEADDALFRKLNLLASRNTMLGNILNLCAVALPNGTNAAGLPTSFQLAAPHGEDERLLAAALEIERVIRTAAECNL